jgi:hypothetical protein
MANTALLLSPHRITPSYVSRVCGFRIALLVQNEPFPTSRVTRHDQIRSKPRFHFRFDWNPKSEEIMKAHDYCVLRFPLFESLGT